MVKKGIVLGDIISRYRIEVRSFLGHADFYRRFNKDFSKTMKPLTNLLAKDLPFHFSEECLMTFTKLKKALNSTPVLYPSI